MKMYITGVRRGLGKALEDRYGNVSLEECDVFINCKHDGFQQVELLYRAANMNKRIVNIGSHASDFTHLHKYAVEKKALREANHQLFMEGKNTTILNFGYIDTERTADQDVKKMSVSYCIDIIEWVLEQPHRIKEMTIVAD